ncbi:MAG: alpha/beta fold hydrolase [Candidatus Rickettsia vulgarisii]
MKNFYNLNRLLAYMIMLFIVTGCHNDHKINNFNYQNQISSGYIEVDNGKLFYQKFGSGKPMIIVHGGPGLDQSYLLPQMLELAKDHELIFYDQRGSSGNSLEASLNPKYVSLDQFSEDLEKLRLGLGLTKFTLVGHSWGGLLSMNYAIKHPENVSSLILLNLVPADYRGQKSFIDELTNRTKPIQHKISALFNYKEFQNLDNEQINKLYKDFFSVYFNDPSEVFKLSLKMNKNLP